MEEDATNTDDKTFMSVSVSVTADDCAMMSAYEFPNATMGEANLVSVTDDT